MNTEIFQKIIDELSKYLDMKWSKLIFYVEYGEDSYSMCFYVKDNGVYIKCFDLPNINENDLISSFEKINDAVSSFRNTEKDKWSNMTLIVDDTGKMKTEYDYTDLSEISFKYKKEWKNKYLI